MLNFNTKRILTRYLPITIALFFLAVYFGYLAATAFPEIGDAIMEQLQEKFGPIKNESNLYILGYIFINNTLIDLSAILSFFLFGLGSILILISNGLTIGIVLNIFQQKESLTTIIAGLAPHGMLEIPSFLLATAVGLWLGVRLLMKILKNEPFRPNILFALKFFFFVIVPLNLVAALIETYITPLIYSGLQ